jgi:zinc/manganese transport system ATP-binding protein
MNPHLTPHQPYLCCILRCFLIASMSLASFSPPLLELCNLTLGYERHPAVHHLSLGLAAGDLVAIVGPNGAGKSTLMKALAGVLRPMQGQIKGLPSAPAQGWLRWRTTPHPSYRIAYLPQQAEMDRQFPITVIDMVRMGLWHEVGALGRFSPAQHHRCEAALAQVGLTGFAQRTIGTLSGGQFQRALFARLLLQDAQLILLDEPFMGVDTRTTRDLLALIHQWHTQGRTVVAVLHDMEQVQHHFPTTWLLARELVAAGPTASVLTAAHLARARVLNEAFDDDAPDCDVPDSAELAPHPAHAHTHTHGHEHAYAHGHPKTHQTIAAYASKSSDGAVL